MNRKRTSSLLKPVILSTTLIFSFAQLTSTHASTLTNQTENELVATHLKKILEPVAPFFKVILDFKPLVKPIVEESIKAHENNNIDHVSLKNSSIPLLNKLIEKNPAVIGRILSAQKSIKSVLEKLDYPQTRNISSPLLLKFLQQNTSIVTFCDQEITQQASLSQLCHELLNFFNDLMNSLSPAAKDSFKKLMHDMKSKK